MSVLLRIFVRFAFTRLVKLGTSMATSRFDVDNRSEIINTDEKMDGSLFSHGYRPGLKDYDAVRPPDALYRQSPTLTGCKTLVLKQAIS